MILGRMLLIHRRYSQERKHMRSNACPDLTVRLTYQSVTHSYLQRCDSVLQCRQHSRCQDNMMSAKKVLIKAHSTRGFRIPGTRTCTGFHKQPHVKSKQWLRTHDGSGALLSNGSPSLILSSSEHCCACVLPTCISAKTLLGEKEEKSAQL